MTTSHDHHRRSIRLREYDYSQAGAYFVTVCSWERECRFGEVTDGVMRLNGEGELVGECWRAIPDHFAMIEAVDYVVMPNHIHGIIIIPPVGTTHASPHNASPNGGSPEEIPCAEISSKGTSHHDSPIGNGNHLVVPRFFRATHASPLRSGPPPKSLGAVVGSFKSAVTKRINIIRNNPGGPVWQRNYYEHIIRDEADYLRIVEYIENNPLRWADDSLHPSKHP